MMSTGMTHGRHVYTTNGMILYDRRYDMRWLSLHRQIHQGYHFHIFMNYESLCTQPRLIPNKTQQQHMVWDPPPLLTSRAAAVAVCIQSASLAGNGGTAGREIRLGRE